LSGGWLVNSDRRKRRDNPLTLTDRQVMELIRKIEQAKRYTRLGGDADRFLRLRDKSLIAQSWIFFKRANENLRTRLSNVHYDNRELLITFHIQKRRRRRKVCPECGVQNATRANYCRKCGRNLGDVEVSVLGEELTVTKRKSIKYTFCRHVTVWVETLRNELGRGGEDYLYAPYNNFAEDFLFDRHLTVQRVNQILQRLDPTLTSHMFRYGASEKLLSLGYTPSELKDIGDWSTTRMPELYAERKGLTIPQRKFATDTRTI